MNARAVIFIRIQSNKWLSRLIHPTRIKLRISRSNPETNSEEKFDEFVIPVEKYSTVLDVLLNVKSHLDHSVGVRYSCRQASCGSCGMKINGKPKLACFTKIETNIHSF